MSHFLINSSSLEDLIDNIEIRFGIYLPYLMVYLPGEGMYIVPSPFFSYYRKRFDEMYIKQIERKNKREIIPIEIHSELDLRKKLLKINFSSKNKYLGDIILFLDRFLDGKYFIPVKKPYLIVVARESDKIYVFVRDLGKLETIFSLFSYIYLDCKSGEYCIYSSTIYLKGKDIGKFLDKFIDRTIILIENKNRSMYLFLPQAFPKEENIEIGISGNIDKKQLEYLTENENFHIFFRY